VKRGVAGMSGLCVVVVVSSEVVIESVCVGVSEIECWIVSLSPSVRISSVVLLFVCRYRFLSGATARNGAVWTGIR
jgi:hypothetical protein